MACLLACRTWSSRASMVLVVISDSEVASSRLPRILLDSFEQSCLSKSGRASGTTGDDDLWQYGADGACVVKSLAAAGQGSKGHVPGERQKAGSSEPWLSTPSHRTGRIGAKVPDVVSGNRRELRGSRPASCPTPPGVVYGIVVGSGWNAVLTALASRILRSDDDEEGDRAAPYGRRRSVALCRDLCGFPAKRETP